MNKILSFMMISMLVIPAFAPWLPHGAMHILHDNHMQHHASGHHEHGHHIHQQHHHEHIEASHPSYVDFASFFKDYLHVDLKRSDRQSLDLLVLDTPAVDYFLTAHFYPVHRFSSSIHTRAPPDYLRPRPNHTPIYLSTQRLRI